MVNNLHLSQFRAFVIVLPYHCQEVRSVFLLFSFPPQICIQFHHLVPNFCLNNVLTKILFLTNLHSPKPAYLFHPSACPHLGDFPMFFCHSFVKFILLLLLTLTSYKTFDHFIQLFLHRSTENVLFRNFFWAFSFSPPWFIYLLTIFSIYVNLPVLVVLFQL